MHLGHQSYDPSEDEDDRDETRDNAGKLSIDTSGDPSIGIGGGLGIDLANGDLTMQIAPGLSIDL